jgi:hypothetical protein
MKLFHLDRHWQQAEEDKAIAVHVIGVPASGDSPKQAFASCAELQAFEN